MVIAGIVIFISFFLFIFIGIAFAVPIFNISSADLLDLSNVDNINFLKYLQIIQSFGLFIFPAFIIAYLFNRNIGGYLKYTTAPKIIDVVKVSLLMILAIPLINFTAQLNSDTLDLILPEDNWLKTMENVALEMTEKFLNVSTFPDLLLNIFVIAVLPAIGEELIFRGIVQKLFVEWTKNIHIGVVFAALIFSTIHFQFYGFLPRFLMGLLFGYLYVWSGTIWVPIIAHFVNNGFAVIIGYLIFNKSIPDNVETIGANKTSLIYLIISVITTGILIYSIYKKKQRIL